MSNIDLSSTFRQYITSCDNYQKTVNVKGMKELAEFICYISGGGIITSNQTELESLQNAAKTYLEETAPFEMMITFAELICRAGDPKILQILGCLNSSDEDWRSLRSAATNYLENNATEYDKARLLNCLLRLNENKVINLSEENQNPECASDNEMMTYLAELIYTSHILPLLAKEPESLHSAATNYLKGEANQQQVKDLAEYLYSLCKNNNLDFSDENRRHAFKAARIYLSHPIMPQGSKAFEEKMETFKSSLITTRSLLGL